jgi:hypothetical protein
MRVNANSHLPSLINFSSSLKYILFFKAATSLYEEVDIASNNAHKASGYTELDISKLGKNEDGNYEPLLKENDRYGIPAPEGPQYEIPGQKGTNEKPKMPPQNSDYTELKLEGRIQTDDSAYQKLIKRDIA